MQDRYRMYRRNKGNFYLEDILTGKQQSLRTQSEAAAKRMLAGKNQSVEQPQMNLAMARVYLASKSPELMTRTWDDMMKDMEADYQDGTKIRWQKMMRCAPFQIIRNLPLLYTESAHFLAVLRHPNSTSPVPENPQTMGIQNHSTACCAMNCSTPKSSSP